jgi:chromosome segregation ATPase
MKSLFLFFTIVISINSIAQSKKEQIDILNVRVDSLNSAYVKDTKFLSNAVQKVNKENVDLSEQLEKSKEQLKKKSATITDKSATIKSLNARNMDLMNEIKELRTGQKNLMAQQKNIKVFA